MKCEIFEIEKLWNPDQGHAPCICGSICCRSTPRADPHTHRLRPIHLSIDICSIMDGVKVFKTKWRKLMSIHIFLLTNAHTQIHSHTHTFPPFLSRTSPPLPFSSLPPPPSIPPFPSSPQPSTAKATDLVESFRLVVGWRKAEACQSSGGRFWC